MMWDDGSTAARAAVCSADLSFSCCPSGSTSSLYLIDSMRPSISIFDFNDSITAAGAAVETAR